MASNYDQIEERITAQLHLPIPDEVFRQVGLFDHLYDFTDHIVNPVDLWVRDAGINDVDRGVVLAMGDGLKIAVYGLGQVIRQSRTPKQLSQAARLYRLRSGATILRSIADLGLDTAVSLEEVYGFRVEDYHHFNRPNLPLNFSGDVVSLSGHPLPSPSDTPGGCPFKKHLQRIYEPLTICMLPFFDIDFSKT